MRLYINKRHKIARNDSEGFTLAELVIALPVATLIVVSLISILFNQYTVLLAESAESSLRSSGQALLNTLQDELLFTIEYGHDLQSHLSDPYDPVGGWDYDTDPDDTLIIHEVALDGTRADSNRNVIRERLSNCASSAITANPVALNNIIYFVEDIPGSTYKALKKRTIIPSFNTCSIDRNTGNPCAPATSTCFGNAKDTSCPDANVGTGSCTEADKLLSQNVIDFDVTYYATNNIVTTFPSAAELIEVTLVLGDRVYGQDVETIVSHTIRKIN